MSHLFACCTSQKKHGHARITPQQEKQMDMRESHARNAEMRVILSCPCVEMRANLACPCVFYLCNMQKCVTKSDTSGHCLMERNMITHYRIRSELPNVH